MERSELFVLAADAILVVHAGFVIFVIAGLLLILTGAVLGWSWVRHPWFRLLHLAAIVVVVLQSWLGQRCPLTHWELALRSAAGQATYGETFVAHWLGRLLYYDLPAWMFIAAYTAFGILVVLSWLIVRPGPFRQANDGGSRGESR